MPSPSNTPRATSPGAASPDLVKQGAPEEPPETTRPEAHDPAEAAEAAPPPAEAEFEFDEAPEGFGDRDEFEEIPELPPLSAEQEELVKCIASRNSAVVEAVAGSGKSTAVMHLAKRFPCKKILQLTYNSHLKMEVRDKVELHNIPNLEVHSYHALAVKYYGTGDRDDAILRLVNNNKKPKREIKNFDLVIVDEAQDCTRLYFRLVCKFVKDMKEGGIKWRAEAAKGKCEAALKKARAQIAKTKAARKVTPSAVKRTEALLGKLEAALDEVRDLLPGEDEDYDVEEMAVEDLETRLEQAERDFGKLKPELDELVKATDDSALQIVLLGDRRQCINQFAGADHRYLTLGSQIFQPLITPGTAFQTVQFRVSYRVNQSVAHFVNRALLQRNVIVAHDTGAEIGEPAVHYLAGSFVPAEAVAQIILDELGRGAVTPGDVFVLGPSIKTNTGRGVGSYMSRIENFLVAQRIPCYNTKNEGDNRVNQDVVAGKVVFTTFHQSKGRERKLVVVVSFNSEYFKYYSRLPNDTCPNTFYVAATRSKGKLIVVQGGTPAVFLNERALTLPHVKKVGGIRRSSARELTESGAPHRNNFTFTELTDRLKEELILDLEARLADRFVTVAEPHLETHYPPLIDGVQGLEEASDLTGLAVPSIWEQTQLHRSTLLEYVADNTDKVPEFARERYAALQEKDLAEFTIEESVWLAALYNAITNRFHSRLRQIANFNYAPDSVQESLGVLDAIFSKEDAGTIKMEKNIKWLFQMPGEYEGEAYVVGRMDCAVADRRRVKLPVFAEESGSGGTLAERHKNLRAEQRRLRTFKAVWEFKCKQELQLTDKLQVVLYQALWRAMNPDLQPPPFYLLNIRTGERLRLEISYEEGQAILQTLVRAKTEEIRQESDEEFVAENRKYSE